MPNAGAATAVIQRAADGVVGTSDGLAATAAWGCLSALPGSEGHRGLAELTALALEGSGPLQSGPQAAPGVSGLRRDRLGPGASPRRLLPTPKPLLLPTLRRCSAHLVRRGFDRPRLHLHRHVLHRLLRLHQLHLRHVLCPRRGFARVWVSGFAFPRRPGFRVSPILPLGFGFRVSAWWICITNRGRGAEPRKTNLNDLGQKRTFS